MFGYHYNIFIRENYACRPNVPYQKRKALHAPGSKKRVACVLLISGINIYYPENMVDIWLYYDAFCQIPS